MLQLLCRLVYIYIKGHKKIMRDPESESDIELVTPQMSPLPIKVINNENN